MTNYKVSFLKLLTDTFNELKIIQDGISDIRHTTVCKQYVKYNVASIVTKIKVEIQKKILTRSETQV